jgi:hypothetical protein
MTTGNKRGRPPKGDGPRLDYLELDRLLVEGELVVHADGRPERVFPTLRDLAKRFSVCHSVIVRYAQSRNVAKRRARTVAGDKLKAKREATPVVARPRPRPPAPEEEALPPMAVLSDDVAGDDDDAGAAADSAPKDVAREVTAIDAAPLRSSLPNTEGVVPYELLDRLLVFGELVTLDDGTQTTLYPSHAALAERFGLTENQVKHYARSHECTRRRQEAKTRIAIRTEQKLVEMRAEAAAVSKEHAVRIIDTFLLNFEAAIEEGRVRFDNPADFNSMLRLKEFVQGGADSRQEIHGSVTLGDLQARHARMLRVERDTAPEQSGVIDVTLVSDPNAASDAAPIPEDVSPDDAT